MWDFGHMGGGFMIIWWLVIIVAIIALLKWLVGTGGSNNSTKSARQILDERYARGEIDRLEYEQKKRDLE